MSDIIFMGQEVADFYCYGRVSPAGAPTQPDTRYGLFTGEQDQMFTNRFEGPLAEALGTVNEWFYTQRLFSSFRFGGSDGSHPFASFWEGSNPVIGFGIKDANGTAQITVVGYPGGVAKVLAAAAQSSYVGSAKLDFAVDPSSGRVRVWTDGVPMLDTVVDTTVVKAGNPDKLVLSTPSQQGGYGAVHSGSVLARFDLRGCRLKTLAPVANTDVHQWAGGYGDINDQDYRGSQSSIIADADGQESVFKADTLPDGEFSIKGLKLTGVFVRGDEGPDKVQLGYDLGGGVTYFPVADVDTGPTWVRCYTETQGSNGIALTQDQINALKIAVKSVGYITL